MKRVIYLVSILVVLVGITSVALAEKKPIKLKAVQFLNLGNPAEKGFHLLVDSINKAAKGELVIEIVGGPEAIPARQQLESVRVGAVDMCWVPSGWYKSVVPVAAVLNLSRIGPSGARKSGLHDFLVKEHKKAGLRFIGATDVGGPFFLYAKEPLKSSAEIKGKRFRHSPTHAFFKAVGLVPITVGHGDIYTGLERNLLDGLATKHATFINLSLFEVCKYVVGPSYWGSGYGSVTILNEGTFAGLPKNLQDLILNTQEKKEPQMKEMELSLLEGQWKTLREKGVKHIKWSPEDSKAFLEEIDQAAWKVHGKRLPPGMEDKLKKMMGY
ncbi:MAG: TRAP transporter substrate-binding protein DctP [Deltaproteobacteria bacterium]|nr:TRAP transporter substrate-binding protein DctP [Deltaproteobacteria bacterium]